MAGKRAETSGPRAQVPRKSPGGGDSFLEQQGPGRIWRTSGLRSRLCAGTATRVAVSWEGLVFHQRRVLGLETRPAEGVRAGEPAWRRGARVGAGF